MGVDFAEQESIWQNRTRFGLRPDGNRFGQIGTDWQLPSEKHGQLTGDPGDVACSDRVAGEGGDVSAEAVADDVEAVDVSSGVDQEVDEQRHLFADCLDVRHRAEVQRGLA